jgi:hypothetical protein
VRLVIDDVLVQERVLAEQMAATFLRSSAPCRWCQRACADHTMEEVWRCSEEMGRAAIATTPPLRETQADRLRRAMCVVRQAVAAHRDDPDAAARESVQQLEMLGLIAR